MLDRRQGVSAYYRLNEQLPPATRNCWAPCMRSWTMPCSTGCRPPAQRAAERHSGAWADRRRQHGAPTRPGAPWETLTHAFTRLLDPGDVVDVGSGDGVIAGLLAARARSIVCLDISERVVTAARSRLAGLGNVRVELGDMHALPLPDASADLVLLLNTLTYSDKPGKAVAEAARLLRPGGRLLATTLDRHDHAEAVRPFGHVNLGFRRDDLQRYCRQAWLEVGSLDRGERERRPPHFEILTLVARRP